ncbi:nuclear transport factor 2 family protein [Pseudonocardia pini]|uniref:nuclear transport factor 2 family protein n=1 Tax=Pseudonocardia pini TaxID=2758030 RepID=UPI0015F08B59|nr:nuclear transport factor 2 family protein [Pseudonocardia pini]
MSWIEDYYGAWSADDAEAVAAFMAEDVVFEDVTAGHVARGPRQVRRFVEICAERVPGARYEVVRSHACPDTYAVEWVMQPMGVRGASYGTLRDGLITGNRDYWNGAVFTP